MTLRELMKLLEQRSEDQTLDATLRVLVKNSGYYDVTDCGWSFMNELVFLITVPAEDRPALRVV